MWKDPIVEEVQRIRKAHAKQFNHDLDAICEDLKRQREDLKRQGWKFARPPRRRRAAEKLAA